MPSWPRPLAPRRPSRSTDRRTLPRMADALFRRLSANQFEPTDLARGPWDRDALHGGPSAALFAAAAQSALGDDMFPSRLTIELLRPVPVAPLTVETELIRPGRKVRLVAIRLRAADA